MHHLRGPFTTGAVAMPFLVQLISDSRYGQPTTIPGLASKLAHMIEQGLLDREMSVGLHAFHTFAACAFSFPSRSKFEDRHALVELRHGAQHLPDQITCWIVAFIRQVHTIRRHDART